MNVGTIALDTGDVPYVHRVNAATLASISVSSPVITATGGSTLQEIVDESPVGLLASYTPCTGLIGLGDIQARSISSIVIDRATPLSPINDLEVYNTMNDFKGVITVSGAIGSLVGPNSALKGTVIAGSIGTSTSASSAARSRPPTRRNHSRSHFPPNSRASSTRRAI